MRKKAETIKDDKNWYKDRYQYVVMQRKLLALITLLSLLGTLATVFVISQLTPLKTIEPFVIQVDQRSGMTQTVDPLSVRELTSSELVNNYFIVQYIRAREDFAYSPTTGPAMRRNYDLVRLMSDSEKVYPKFYVWANPNNPDSPAARLSTTGTRSVKIQSITYLAPQLVQVRILIEETGSVTPQQHKIVLMSFDYVKMTLTTEERYANPLGFRVTDYRVDEDIVQK